MVSGRRCGDMMDCVERDLFAIPLGGPYRSIKSPKRLDLFGYHFASNKNYVVLTVVVFVLIGMLVLALRRGSYGRLLIALRDRVAPLVKQGKTQEEVVAAKLTADYDGKVPEPGTTGDRFITQLYAELKAGAGSQ